MRSLRIVSVSAGGLQTALRSRLLGEVGRVISLSRVGQDVELYNISELSQNTSDDLSTHAARLGSCLTWW